MSDPPVPPALPPAPRGGGIWFWINGLALDAVAVAMAWLAVFAGMTGARMTPVNFGVLAAAVWLVYMADRLADGWSGAGTEGRHKFAVNHARWLLPVMALLAGAAGWGALHDMRWITVQAGLVLTAGVGLYFSIVALSRWKAASQLLLLGMGAVMILGLIQGEPGEAAGVQLWRAVASGTLLTMLYFGLRQQFDPPPWTLVKKGMSGYLFALGVALGPFSHLQDWAGLLHTAPVVLFGGACTLNSMGIRLWEKQFSMTPELQLLRRLYPWLLVAVGGGAVTQAWTADVWARPVLIGIAACAGGFALIRELGKRWPELAFPRLADGWMILVAGVVLWAGFR